MYRYVHALDVWYAGWLGKAARPVQASAVLPLLIGSYCIKSFEPLSNSRKTGTMHLAQEWHACTTQIQHSVALNTGTGHVAALQTRCRGDSCSHAPVLKA